MSTFCTLSDSSCLYCETWFLITNSTRRLELHNTNEPLKDSSPLKRASPLRGLSYSRRDCIQVSQDGGRVFSHKKVRYSSDERQRLFTRTFCRCVTPHVDVFKTESNIRCISHGLNDL